MSVSIEDVWESRIRRSTFNIIIIIIIIADIHLCGSIMMAWQTSSGLELEVCEMRHMAPHR